MFDTLLDDFEEDVSRTDEEDGFRKLSSSAVLDEEGTTSTEQSETTSTDTIEKPEDEEFLLAAEESESWSDDPVRMYLTQMGEIPLLTRQQEIELAKKIEVTRRRFRTKLLECDYVIQSAFKVLKRVHDGELPFDRTVQVSVTDRLEKDQILGRLPHNLCTLAILLKRNRRDYSIASSRSYLKGKRRLAWQRLSHRRRRAVRLVEELGLRTQRIESLVRTLEDFSRGVDDLKARIDAHKKARRSDVGKAAAILISPPALQSRPRAA